MPGSKKKASKPSTAPRPRLGAGVAALAWSGQHEQAIALATAALDDTKLALAARLESLDLRAESRVALGDVKAAGEDVGAMQDLARRARKPSLLAQALNRRA